MGLVWPWTGPAASAKLAPYLVGIVVQFAFEQYARCKKSCSWPVIQIVFQVYRLHQLNITAQLVTTLSFTIKGAEMTPNNLAINSSLGTLLNVLQCLGIICIWSLSSFLMRFFPSNAATVHRIERFQNILLYNSKLKCMLIWEFVDDVMIKGE
uniref:Uncharacterized protein n=1 Tax=Cucumis sativus TaxID=3659 RepID=A0A0A0LYV4_CUCSA